MRKIIEQLLKTEHKRCHFPLKNTSYVELMYFLIHSSDKLFVS